MSINKKPKKTRLDDWLIEHGLAENKQAAFILVTEGRVFAEGHKAVSPAQEFYRDAKIEVRGQKLYVGRGAEKLAAAMEFFHINAEGKTCADIGAATGGFTQVLLKHDAKKVYAIDTAKGKLDIKLREDPRVVVMERTDVRDIKELSEVPELSVIDISLISLRNILPSVRRLMHNRGCIIALFKPQYETRDPKILHHGVIKNDEARKRLLDDFIFWLREHGWILHSWTESPIRGNEGNKEYLLYIAADRK